MISMLTRIQKKEKLAVGLMSGTSLDGIDAALVQIKGSGPDTEIKLIEFETLNYSSEEREQILALCEPGSSSVDEICRWNVLLGKKMAEAALLVIEKAGYSPHEVDFISSHGQTIYHMPDEYATLQIGELAVIAAETGCITVGDFRPSDMAVRGQGAPLVPFVDSLLFQSNNKGRILLNIGGISNMTVLPVGIQENEIMAFDCGPGNVLIDALTKIGSNGRFSYDENGDIAASGKVDLDWLDKLLEQDPFLVKEPPKSTGREYYTIEKAQNWWKVGQSRGLSFADILATVTAFTAQSIIVTIARFIDNKHSIDELFVGGGGVHNSFLMQQLQDGLNQRVASMEELNLSSDAKEAIAFVVLGNEFIHGNTNNLPSATGAKRATIMGKLVLP